MTDIQMTDHTETHVMCDNQPGIYCWHTKDNVATKTEQSVPVAVETTGSSDDEEADVEATEQVAVELVEDDTTVKATADSSLAASAVVGASILIGPILIGIGIGALVRFVLKD
jgi:hypothetical protein